MFADRLDIERLSGNSVRSYMLLFLLPEDSVLSPGKDYIYWRPDHRLSRQAVAEDQESAVASVEIYLSAVHHLFVCAASSRLHCTDTVSHSRRNRCRCCA